MKSRIEELANKAMTQAQETGPRYAITVAITDAVNEALELAAKECEELPTDDKAPSFNDDFNDGCYECAEAIRKLKCS